MGTDNREGVSVHAGFPNPATDTDLEGLSLTQLLISHPVSTFFLRIKGHRWEDKGIFEGDIAIVDRALTPHKMDLAIWWQDDSFIISKHWAVPEDTEMWGVVTAIVHQYRKP